MRDDPPSNSKGHEASATHHRYYSMHVVQNGISFWGALIRYLPLLSPLCHCCLTHSGGSVWLGTTFEVSLGLSKEKRVAGVD